jgi:imidazole glycerol phosphate synthase subunit HisF
MGLWRQATYCKRSLAWVQEAEDRGAGEILLTSIDRDGTGDGFDCVLTSGVAVAVVFPSLPPAARVTRATCAGF